MALKWLHPMLTYDQVKPLHIPGSRITYTEADLNDLFAAPDFYIDLHIVLPYPTRNAAYVVRLMPSGYSL